MKKIFVVLMAVIVVFSLTLSVIAVNESDKELILYENEPPGEADPVDEPIDDPPEEPESDGGEEGSASSDDPDKDPDDKGEEEELEILHEDPLDFPTMDIENLEIQADTVMLMSNLPEDNDYPSGAPLRGGVYIHADTDQLGEIIIYVPTEDQYKAFTYNTSGQPINITGSTITGYTYTGNDYYVRWNSFGQAQYRLVNNTGYGTSYEDLDIYEVLNTNVVFIEGNEDLNPLPDETVLSILIFSLVGGCFFCLLLKRL